MTHVPLRLRQRFAPAPATALLLPAGDTEQLLRLCIRLGLDPWPAVYPLADGFLVKLPRPISAVPAGVIGLRDLAPNLHVPAGAELLPPLLDDEAAALTRSRGLVFLPGRRVLAYDPGATVPLPRLARITPVTRPAWTALPQPPALAERLFELRVLVPPPAADAVLEQGQGDIGVEAPDLPDVSAAKKLVGGAQFNLGRALAWLGKSLHIPGLSRAGAAMVGAAMNLVPRLNEKVFGRQEAALRELLRQFQQGKIEEALRRALPLRKDLLRGAAPTDSSRLPIHDTRYSLRNLLAGHGAGGVWYGGAEQVFRELQAEYRKLAEQATREGDFRRAAFIYGKLLDDLRSAANALSQGGLHRDAAVLYLERLKDRPAAAREFEAAGEPDRALQIYDQLGDHLSAAELLRRIGEEERAVAEFEQAALRLVQHGRGHADAGDLLLNKAGRPDLALPYFQRGWAERPGGSYLLCARRLLHMYAQEETTAELLAIMDDADEFFAPAGNESAAATFYNEVARVAGKPALAAIAADLRDRALVGLAGKMRHQAAQRIAPARVVANLLLPNANWPPALLSDAQYAVQLANKTEKRAPQRREPTHLTIPARVSVVTAVCCAPETGHLFIGFASGEVVRLDPQFHQILEITNERRRVLALATDPTGDDLVVLSAHRSQEVRVDLFTQPSGYRMVGSQMLEASDRCILSPVLAGPWRRESGPKMALFWNGQELQLLLCTSLLPIRHWDCDHLQFHPDIVLPSFAATCDASKIGLFLVCGQYIIHSTPPNSKSWHSVDLGWSPGNSRQSTLLHPRFSWLYHGEEGLELAGIDREGTLHHTCLALHENRLSVSERHTGAAHGPFLAAGLVRPGVVAAVSGTAVYWLGTSGTGFRVLDRVDISLPEAIACYPYAPGGTLVVLGGDGRVALIPQRSL